MSDTYQLTRIEKIFPNRQEALEKLSSLSLEFGTLVSIRYLISPGESCNCGCGHTIPGFDEDTRMMIAAYLNGEEGNYFIIADSNLPLGSGNGSNSNNLVIYQGTIFEGQSWEEAISSTFFGIDPKEKDIVILTDKETKEISTYILLGKNWTKIGSAKQDIQFNKDQFSYNPKTSEVTIKTIYGGEF